jgi:hypothetical protein
MGIGLTIVQSIVRNQGTIAARNNRAGRDIYGDPCAAL